MLKKEYRLRKRQDFKKTYQRGKAVKNKYFVLYYSPNQTGKCQIGFSVSKKIGKAVVRNQVKRKLREACLGVLPLFAPGYNYIFIARYPIKYSSVQELEQLVKEKLFDLKLKPRRPKPPKRA